MAEVKNPITPEIIESPSKYAKTLLEASTAADKLIESLLKLIDVNKKIPTSDDEVAKKKKQLTEVEKEANRIAVKSEKTQAKLILVRTKKAKALAAETIELREATKEVKNNIVESKRSVLAVEAQKGAYNAISKALSANLISWKKLTAAERENSVKGQQLTATIKKQREELSKLDKTTGLASRGVGKYKEGVIGAAKSLFGALGLIGGIAGLVKVMSSSIMISLQFEAAMSKVKAISGATATEYKALKDQAKLLGEQTQKTATDAAQLQIELSKIGFSPKQIINSTDAILQLSIATGEDLAQSAKVAAGTLKSFNKDASDASQITDIMAKSFSSSALDLTKFETAVSQAGPTLNAMGISVERMTAQLAILVDRNIDASSAGTGLRNVYLDLNKHGMTLTEALEDINNSSNKANRAFELFGKRGATVAVVLAENQDAADKLTTSFENAGGSAARMAEIMIDNLKGDTDKASSAMQGLAINLGERLTPSLRSVTQGFTDIVSALSEFAKIDSADLLRDEQLEVNKLAIELTNTNTTLERRNEIYSELEDIAPDVIKNIDTENVSIVTLRGNLEKYNQTLIKKLALAETEVLKSEANKEASEALEERLKKEDNARSLLFKTQQKANESGGEFKKTIDDIVLSSIPLEDKLIKAKEALAEQSSGFGQSQLEMAKFRTQTVLFNDAISELTEAQDKEEIATQNASSALQIYTDRYNRIFGADAVTGGVDAFVDGLIEIEENLNDIDFDNKFRQFQEASVDAILKSTAKSAKVLDKFRKEQLKEEEKSAKLQSDVDLRIRLDTGKEIEKADEDTDKEILNNAKQLSSDLSKLNKSNADFAINQTEREAAQRIAIQNTVRDKIIELSAQGAQAITDILLESSSQRRDAELELVDERREEDLEILDEQTQEDIAKVDEDLENGFIKEKAASDKKDGILADSKAKKAIIEKEADAKAAAIKTKQAKAEKTAALISIQINTAAAIIKTAATLGFPPAIPFIAIAAATGALETAIVLATPTPKFKKGTHGKFNTPSEFIAGDGGVEGLVAPDGTLSLTPNKPTLYSDMANHQVVPAGETKKMLNEMNGSGGMSIYNDAGVRNDLKTMIKVMKNQPRTIQGDGYISTKRNNHHQKQHVGFLDTRKA